MSDRLISEAAELLGELVEELVFVGAASVAYWIGLGPTVIPRTTMDVDAVADIHSKAAYDRFGGRLRAKGFEVDSESRVIVRWVHAGSGLVLDVMPATDSVFGFGGGWQAEALANPQSVRLRSGATVEVATPPYILAMKLDAFRSRGRDDLLRSHDIEDILLLLAATDDIAEQVARSPRRLIEFLADQLMAITEHPRYSYAAEGAFSAYESGAILAERVVEIRIPALIALGGDD